MCNSFNNQGKFVPKVEMFQVPFKQYAFNKYAKMIMSTFWFQIFTICSTFVNNELQIGYELGIENPDKHNQAAYLTSKSDPQFTF